MKYRNLDKGEIIQAGDEYDNCANPWRDDAVWVPANDIGGIAPDPQYPAHRLYRRRVVEMEGK